MAFVTTVAPKKRAPRPQGVAPTAQWSWTPAPHRRSGPDRRPGRSPARCAWGARASPPLEAGAFEKTNNGAFCLEICSGNIWKVGMFGDWFWGDLEIVRFWEVFYGTKHDSAGMVGLEIVFGEGDFQKLWEAAWCLGVLTDLLVQHCMFRDFSLKHARVWKNAKKVSQNQPESHN